MLRNINAIEILSVQMSDFDVVFTRAASAMYSLAAADVVGFAE